MFSTLPPSPPRGIIDQVVVLLIVDVCPNEIVASTDAYDDDKRKRIMILLIVSKMVVLGGRYFKYFVMPLR